jgi:hypothetical protein
MKRIITLIIISIVCLYACNKPNENTSATAQKDAPPKLFLINDTITSIGDMHDTLVMTYINDYGLPDSVSHGYDSVRAIVTRIVTIAVHKNYTETSSISNEVDGIMASMLDAGVLDNNYNLKERAGIQAAIMGTISNQNIRNAIENINQYGHPGNLLTYADNQLKALSGLSTLEQNMIGGYYGILEGSYQTWGAMWDNLSQLEKVAVFARADAMGSAIGFHNCVANGTVLMGPQYVTAKMAESAAYYSILATKW